MFKVIAYYNLNYTGVNLERIMNLHESGNLPPEIAEHIQYANEDKPLINILENFRPTPFVAAWWTDDLGATIRWEEFRVQELLCILQKSKEKTIQAAA